MKKFILCLGILALSFAVQAQGLKKEKCKCEEVIIQTFSGTLPEHAVVVNSPTICLGRKVDAMSDLSERELKKMKKWARKFKSCTVYVDVEQRFIDRELNPLYNDDYLTYLVVLSEE